MNLWQIAWRNLMRRKLRTLLTILSIVIGVASTFGVIASVDTAQRAFPLYLKAAFGKADYTVYGTETYFSEGVHNQVHTIDGAASVGFLKQSAKLYMQENNITSIQKRVDLKGYSDLDTPLTGFKLVEGNLSSGGGCHYRSHG